MPSHQVTVHQKHDYLWNSCLHHPTSKADNRHEQPSKQNHHAIIFYGHWSSSVVSFINCLKQTTSKTSSTLAATVHFIHATTAALGPQFASNH
jgi:hypothetical protein